MIAAQTILALDGHDAAGKTTLARQLADALGAVHVRPFSGAKGTRLLELAGRDPDAVTSFARDVVAAASVAAGGNVLVFDRHWMTVCSLLPERLWPPCRPVPTALCWADLPTTLARLEARGEPGDSLAEHAHYLKIYNRLASRYGCLLVRTDRESEERSLARLVAWSRRYLPASAAQEST